MCAGDPGGGAVPPCGLCPGISSWIPACQLAVLCQPLPGAACPFMHPTRLPTHFHASRIMLQDHLCDHLKQLDIEPSFRWAKRALLGAAPSSAFALLAVGSPLSCQPGGAGLECTAPNIRHLHGQLCLAPALHSRQGASTHNSYTISVLNACLAALVTCPSASPR